MKQLDLELLIRAAREKIEYHASVGVGLRFCIQVARQNELPVLKGVCEIVQSILGNELIDADTSDTELTTRSNILFRNLFYKKRILVEVKVKSWPETAGSHLMFDCGSWDYMLFDQETCEGYLAYLERN
uniref:Uncharacterized protein n=1 Tax=Pseudomonas phage RVTF4 TaxID=3236931 RepID=A0AB39CD66_9VIRU